MPENSTPEIYPIPSPTIVAPKKHFLTNNIPVYSIKGGEQEVVKIDFIFDAGHWYQTKKLIASITNSMLNEGNCEMNAAQIAEHFDYRGAYINFSTDQHSAYVSILSLNKHIDLIIEATAAIIKHSTFEQDQIDTLLAKRKSRFEVEMEKVKNQCHFDFTQKMFGKNHPYSLSTTIDDFDNIERQDLIDFYRKYYCSNNCKIIIAGNPDRNTFDKLEEHFGKNDWHNNGKIDEEVHQDSKASEGEWYRTKQGAVQSAIRVGCRAINQTHPDYCNLSICNTLLGGFFGSRLMSNVREEKGYTYGIYSVLISLRKAGYLYIVTDVANEHYDATIKEIKYELHRLRTTLVTEEELEIVKQYLLGEMVRDMDGAFAQASINKNLIEFGQDASFIDRQYEAIINCRPETIRDMADKYLNEDQMIYTGVGGKCE